MIKPWVKGPSLANIPFRCESLCPVILTVFEKSKPSQSGEKGQRRMTTKLQGRHEQGQVNHHGTLAKGKNSCSS